MNKKVSSFILLFLGAFVLLNLSGCQSTAPISGKNSLSVGIKNNSLAVTFSADGTLWRLLPAKEFMSVDYSKDKGLTYSQAVRVNPIKQKINTWPENLPSIKVTKAGRIMVMYYADGEQKAMSYFSYSDDNGQSFAPSQLISHHAKTSMNYMTEMVLDKQDNVHFFWHDQRDESIDAELGASVLSLYHAKIEIGSENNIKNTLVSHALCSCCRTAIKFTPTGLPVIFMRMVFANGTRDHVLLTKNKVSGWNSPRRISDDQWNIEACPEHGPALAVDELGRSHLAWFTLGKQRQGIFYAQTDDYGKQVSKPLPLGNLDYLPSHPDVIGLGEDVILAWTEFNGTNTVLYVQKSVNRGETWQPAKPLLSSKSSAGHAKLLTDNKHIFVSWVTKHQGHQMIKVK